MSGSVAAGSRGGSVKEDEDEELSEEVKALNARKPPDLWNTVLFFSGADEPTTSTQLMFYLENAKMSIQICIYLASLPAFEQVILDKKKYGLCIQVITDHDTLMAHNNFTFRRFLAQGMMGKAYLLIPLP